MKPSTILAVHLRDTDNLGDQVSTPADYFSFPHPVEKLDTRKARLNRNPVVIFGGGGIAGRIHERMIQPQTLFIPWGVGFTRRGETAPGKVSDKFALYGCRDINVKNTFHVPCASAMSTLFDKVYDIKHEAVLYVNNRPKKVPPKKPSYVKFPNVKGIPTLHNGVTFKEAIEFLGSGNTIITNSYHGAYWGTLLGRKVVIVNPYSSKFFNFEYQPYYCADEDWQQGMKRAPSFPHALLRSRAKNHQFYVRVLDEIAKVNHRFN